MTEEKKRELLEEKERLEEEFGNKRKIQHQNCAYLGQKYYQLVDQQPDLTLRDEELLSYIEQIREMEGEIQLIQERLSEVDAELQQPVTILCPNCGKEMEGNAKFCSECGTDLRKIQYAAPDVEKTPQERVCKKCGNPLGPEAKFCGKCGTPVES